MDAATDPRLEGLRAAYERLKTELVKESLEARRRAENETDKRRLALACVIAGGRLGAVYNLQLIRLSAPSSNPDQSPTVLANNAVRHLCAWSQIGGAPQVVWARHVEACGTPPSFAGLSGTCWLSLIDRWAGDHVSRVLGLLPGLRVMGQAIADLRRDVEEAFRFGLAINPVGRHHMGVVDWMVSDWESEARERDVTGHEPSGRFFTDADLPALNTALDELLVVPADAVDPPAVADGPVRPGGFRWQGRAYSEFRYRGKPHPHLSSMPFRLLELLWEHHDDGADLDLIRDSVWGDQNALIDYDPDVRNHCRRIKAFFESNQIPLKTDWINGRLFLRSAE